MKLIHKYLLMIFLVGLYLNNSSGQDIQCYEFKSKDNCKRQYLSLYGKDSCKYLDSLCRGIGGGYIRGKGIYYVRNDTLVLRLKILESTVGLSDEAYEDSNYTYEESFIMLRKKMISMRSNQELHKIKCK